MTASSLGVSVVNLFVSAVAKLYGWNAEDENIYVFSVYLAGALETVLPGLREWYIQNIGRIR